MNPDNIFNPAKMSQNWNRSTLTAEQARILEQKKWLNQVEKKAGTFQPELAAIYNALRHQNQKNANVILADFLEKSPRLTVHGGKKYTFYRKDLNLAADNDDLNDFCAAKARHCQRLIDCLPADQLTIALFDLVETYGIELQKKEAKQIGKQSFLLRVTSEKWWRRKIKPLAFRVCEQIWREMGRTRRGAGAYVSDYTVRRFLSREQRNRNLLENLEATNERGESFTLSELSDVSVSNPELRRNELMVRMRGFEEFAEQEPGWCGMFYTLTCPSKYHLYSDQKRNEKYNGTTPKEAQKYLCNVWEKVRAKAAREKIEVFGFRVAEPHHDGCPHWHLLIFVKKNREPEFTEIFRYHALRVDGNERGAVEHRFTAKRIEKSKGTAAGYIAKYVAKNIDGFEVGDDWEAQEASTVTSIRVRAWAACWGIRQFQQIGGPSVQVYREFRRLANHPEKIPVEGQSAGTPEQLRMMLIACDDGDWCEYTNQMGGAVLPRLLRPAKLFYSEAVQADTETGEADPIQFKTDKETGKLFAVRAGSYGEVVKSIYGILTDWFYFPLKTRVHNWLIDFIPAKRAASNEVH